MPKFTPRADALEAKLVLSAGGLTPAGYEAARGRIVQAVQRLEATGNLVQAEAALGRAVRTIPGGGALLPTLDAEVASADVAARTLLGSLDDFIRDRVASGEIVLKGSLRRTLGPAVASPAPAVPGPAVPGRASPGSSTTAPTPASLTVNIANGTTSQLYVSFTQVVNGVRTELTGTAVGSGVTARFVPIITRNSTPITVSFQSPTLGYWQVVAPANFGQLRVAYYDGRGQFFFGN